MKAGFLKTTLLAITFFLPATMLSAGQFADRYSENVYEIEVLSKVPGQTIPLSGSIMALSTQGSNVSPFGGVTPARVRVTAQFVGIMLQSDKAGSDIVVSIKNLKDNSSMAAQGHVVMGHDDNGGGYITAG